MEPFEHSDRAGYVRLRFDLANPSEPIYRFDHHIRISDKINKNAGMEDAIMREVFVMFGECLDQWLKKRDMTQPEATS